MRSSAAGALRRAMGLVSRSVEHAVLHRKRWSDGAYRRPARSLITAVGQGVHSQPTGSAVKLSL